MLKNGRKSVLLRKMRVTALLILVFLLGRLILVPSISTDSYFFDIGFSFQSISTVTGGDLSQITLFSLGLGPWMYSMILTRIFHVGKNRRSLSPKVLNFRNNCVFLIVAMIQGLGIAISLDYTSKSVSFFQNVMQTAVILTAGAYVVAWLGNLNSKYGVGKTMIFIAANIVATQIKLIPLMAKTIERIPFLIIVGVLVWFIGVVFLSILFERAEYRIPFYRVSVKNNLVENSYFPIKLLPSGGMPLMYAVTLLTFPRYILLLWSYLWPEQLWTQAVYDFFSTDSVVGLILYSLILLVLSVSFSFFNIDPTEVAKGMRKSGDYFSEIRPGQPTKIFLSEKIYSLGIFNGLFLVVVMNLPLSLALAYPSLRELVSMVGMIPFLVGIALLIKDELDVLRLEKKYKRLFE